MYIYMYVYICVYIDSKLQRLRLSEPSLRTPKCQIRYPRKEKYKGFRACRV